MDFSLFEKMPLGVKILFVLSVFSFVLNLISLPDYFSVSTSNTLYFAYYAFISVFGLAFSPLAAYGFWHGKKWMEKLYWVVLGVGILNVLLVTLVFPDFYDVILSASVNQEELLAAGVDPQAFVSLFKPFILSIAAVGLAYTLVVLWYVRKKKDYFVN